MKWFRILCLAFVFVAAPQLSPAAPDAPPDALGRVEATVNFCVQADAEWADKYKEIGKKSAANMSDKQLANARNSTQYKEAYRATSTELAKIPANKAVETCREALK
jgi:hypothetical protein